MMKRLILLICIICLGSGCAYTHIEKRVTRFDLPEGELKWSNERPKNAKMCLPAAFTDVDGEVMGLYRIDGKNYKAQCPRQFKVSLKGGLFYISKQWMSGNGFQQLTLVYNSQSMTFKDSSKAIRRALCKDEKGAFILESNYPMTLTSFAAECSKHSTNATYLDMGEYGYGYIKYGNFKRPLFVWGVFTQHKQTNWIYIE
jgi:hypothetical protein